eukprot:SM000018S03556  [mRNA]  locus=s18:80:1049:+ [translate_table: standard]
MTLESALKLLGVREGATFDEILQAKKNFQQNNETDQEQLMQVEAAYDILLMQSLSKRRSGKVTDSSVRFADVRKPRPAGSGLPPWLSNTLKYISLSVETPPAKDVAIQGAIYGALAAWTFAGGLGQSEAFHSAGSEVPGLQLAAAFGASLYYLRKQNVKLGKASFMTTGGLVAGALLGSVVEAWLRVDIFPVLGIGSPAVVVSEFAFLSLWFTSLYLR